MSKLVLKACSATPGAGVVFVLRPSTEPAGDLDSGRLKPEAGVVSPVRRKASLLKASYIYTENKL